jgi:hypothetical protein
MEVAVASDNLPAYVARGRLAARAFHLIALRKPQIRSQTTVEDEEETYTIFLDELCVTATKLT